MKTLSATITAILVMTTMAAAQGGQDQITFTRDVAPIFQEKCQTCHRPNTFAPMSLGTYEESRPWARSIKAKVTAREMPPWFIEKTVGIQRFSNDVSLTDREIDIIGRWVDSGAPKGDPADMPPPRVFIDDQTWHIGEPDHIVTLPKDLIVAASAPDKWPEIVVDSGLTEDRYIKGVQIMPTKGFPVFHHIITTIVNDDFEFEGAEQGFGGGSFLNEYALGKKGDVFPEASGRLIKAGSKINFQIHLHSTGKEIPANVALGLKFYPKGYVPKQVVLSNLLGNSPELDIRPNTDNIRTDTYMTMSKPARLLSYQPHMHNRGKAACIEAIYPNGRTEVFNCAKFNFNWHLNYVYSDDAAPLLPAGTVLHAIQWHNNTASNPANNDPDALVTWGQRTVDEMVAPWVSWYYMSEDDFKKETEARRSRQTTLTTTR